MSVSANADPVGALLTKIRRAIDAGVDWVQIREKDLSGGQLLKLTSEAAAAAHDCSGTERRNLTRVIVNDRIDVALAAEAAGLPAVAGVHLGGESVPVEQVVRWRRAGSAPAEFQIGVSCHSVEQCRAAEQAGADYIFFGPVFDTPSKRSFGPAQGLDRLSEICRAIRIPVVAIGGIDRSNAHDCIWAGASGVAAIRLFQNAGNDSELEAFISTLHSLGNIAREGRVKR